MSTKIRVSGYATGCALVLFNSLTFIVFFVLVLALHDAPLLWNVKKTNRLIASYLFYAAWNLPFVILLWPSTVITTAIGVALTLGFGLPDNFRYPCAAIARAIFEPMRIG